MKVEVAMHVQSPTVAVSTLNAGDSFVDPSDARVGVHFGADPNNEAHVAVGFPANGQPGSLPNSYPVIPVEYEMKRV